MLTPLAPDQWDRAKAAHLLNRAGFGGPPGQIDALAQGGFFNAVRLLVDGPAAPAPAPAPEWAQPRDLFALRAKVREAMLSAPSPAPTAAPPEPNAPQGPDAARQMARKQVFKAERDMQQEHIGELRAWWLERMRGAEDPLAEKITLFWHGHFATSSAKVRDGYLMWRQNQTLREHARGNFGALVKAISRDPAMIQWLDLEQSRPPHANENFARELMELFTLGEGNYTEPDILESARAFTGYRIDPRDQSFRFALQQHDGGPKAFMNRRGNFNGDDIIDIILQQPACAQFIARKLWTFFAYENPSPAIVATLANTLRANRFEMRPVLRELFASAEFYSPQAMGTQVKSPVQWMVQTARQLDADLPPGFILQGAMGQMGQVLFAPPSVKGWDGGKAWISTSTLLFRYNLAGAIVKGNDPRANNLRRAMGDGRPHPRLEALLAARQANLPNLPPRPRAYSGIDVAKIAPPELRANPDALLKSLMARVFQVPVPAKDQQAFADYLKATDSPTPGVDEAQVRGVLHLMMSTPQFQLC